MFGKERSIGTESTLEVARVWGEGECRVTTNGYRVSLGNIGNVLELNIIR